MCYGGRMKKLAIIGGGAAGLAAAISAGKHARAAFGNAGRDAGFDALDVTVYEAADRVGKSILVTGNGRCNFTNARLDMWRYHNSDFVKAALDALDARTYAPGVPDGPEKEEGFTPVTDLFEELGMDWWQEEDGRRFPLANKASVVVDVLRAGAAAYGVREACGCAVSAIEPPREQGKPYTLRMADGRFERADAVIISCGGRALSSVDLSGIEGLRLIEQQPMLGPLRVSEKHIPVVRELDNIRVRCNVMLARAEGENAMGCIGSESGELLFRKYGVSGICVFNLSRIAQPGDELNIDFFDLGHHEWAADVIRRRAQGAQRLLGRTPTCAEVLRGFLLPRVIEAVLKPIGIRPDDPCAPDDEEMVSDLGTRLTFFSLEVAGIGDPSLCQVRRGGIDVACVDAQTLQVPGHPGLFAVGEALDVDGPCGGYNLHWAWSSGLLAGQCAAQSLIGVGDGVD